MRSKADKKAYDKMWRASPAGRASAVARSLKYRNSAKGRVSVQTSIDRQTEKYQEAAAARSGLVWVRPSQHDATSVQRALSVWGGL